jgi:simple sugar transport system permease protein
METTQAVGAEPRRDVWSAMRALAGRPAVSGIGSFLLAIGAALLIFALLLLLLGKSPVAVYAAIYVGTLGDSYGWGEIVVKMTPLILCALAAAIPARAGLVNVGADGQLYIGAWLASGVALALGERLPGPILIPLLVVSGAAGGAAWAGLVGVLRARFALNETIASLLLNYVAALIIDYFVHGPWKDRSGMNWPYTAEFAASARLATFGGTRISAGIIIALAATVLYGWWIGRTRWGYSMRVVGGNPEAARRSGLSISRYVVVAMMLGGAMAGIYGMIEVTAIQGRLRGGISQGYGYIGFLVAWLAGQSPARIVVMAALLALLSVGGDVIQISAGLPSSATNILMALILFFVLAGQAKKV